MIQACTGPYSVHAPTQERPNILAGSAMTTPAQRQGLRARKGRRLSTSATRATHSSVGRAHTASIGFGSNVLGHMHIAVAERLVAEPTASAGLKPV